MLKVLIVSPHFPPTNAADMQRVRLILPYLHGCEVSAEVLAVESAQVAGPQDPWLEAGLATEVGIHRVRALCLGWGRVPGLGILTFRALRALRRRGDVLLGNGNFDLVYFSTTQFGVHMLGPRWKRKFGVPFVMDYQDPWVSDYYREHPNIVPPGGRLKYAIASWMCRRQELRVLRHCSGITSVSAAYPVALQTRYPWLVIEEQSAKSKAQSGEKEEQSAKCKARSGEPGEQSAKREAQSEGSVTASQCSSLPLSPSASPFALSSSPSAHSARRDAVSGSEDEAAPLSLPLPLPLRASHFALRSLPALVLPFPGDVRDFERVRAEGIQQSVFDPNDGLRHWVYVGRGGGDMATACRALFAAIAGAMESAKGEAQSERGSEEQRAEGEAQSERKSACGTETPLSLGASPLALSAKGTSLALTASPLALCPLRSLRLHFIGTSYAAAGRGVKTIEPLAAEYGLEGIVVEHPNRIPYSETLRCLLDADALMVPGSDDPGYTASKIYPYLLAGKPLLAVFHEQSSVVELFRQVGGGTVIPFASGESSDSVAIRIASAWQRIGGPEKAVELDWDAFSQYTARSQAVFLVEFWKNCLHFGI